jgi:uncharacterized RDD family membrane protein YckC/Tfp pilus assembly major pilin PilA
MYCAKCGTQGEAGHTVCVKCGTPLTDHPYQAPRAPVTSRVERPTSGPTPYAGFWVRLAAFVIDYIILIVGMGIISALARGVAGQAASFLILLIVPWLYYAIFESSGMQATPGKLALGLRVANEGGDPLGFGAATGRYFGKIITWFTFGVGFAMIVFTERRQSLHDKIAGTLVVKRRWPTEEIASAGPAPAVSPIISVLAVLGLLFFGPGGLGILAAIAIPAYQDYTIRSQVTEGLNLAAPYKAAVAEAVANGQEFDAISTESVQAGAPPVMKYVDHIEVVRGTVQLHYGAAAHAKIAGKSLVLVPGVTDARDVVWVCGYHEAPSGLSMAVADGGQYTSVPPKFLPQSCRAGL